MTPVTRYMACPGCSRRGVTLRAGGDWACRHCDWDASPLDTPVDRADRLILLLRNADHPHRPDGVGVTLPS